MKLWLFLFIVFTSLGNLYAQVSSDKNYIISNVIRQQGITTETQVLLATVESGHKSQTIQYADGLGRPLQSVMSKANPQTKDIIIPVQYDALGREAKKYLPFVDPSQTNNYGGYSSNWNTQQPTFYSSQITGVERESTPTYAFSQTLFEPSPLNRVLAQGSPGAPWQPNVNDPYDQTKNVIKLKSETNTTAEAVKIWTVAIVTTDFDISQITTSGVYANGQLSVSVSIDEHNNLNKEYKDKQGQTVLKRVQENIGWLETYYIYDSKNLLRAVIMPEGVNQLPANLDWAFADKWMFLYEYDGRGRMIMKKVPGSEKVFMVYDRWNRLVLTQDGNLRTQNKFLFTKYDALNRPIINGFYTDSRPIADIQNSATASTVRNEQLASNSYGYTLDQTFPSLGGNPSLLSIFYYDNYANIPWVNNGYSFVAENNVLSYNNQVKGQVVATQTKRLDTQEWINTVTYYDEKYQPIQVITDNVFGKKERVTNRLAFDGLPEEVWSYHNSDFYPSGIFTIKKYSYDHTGRVTTVTSKMGNAEEVTLVSNQYNQVGNLLNKKLHTVQNQSLQQLDFAYNIRGWLININRVENTSGVTQYDPADLFALELKYNNTSLSNTTPQFNGNISEQKWKGPLAETPSAFVYSYDKVNRIKTSQFSQIVNSNWTAPDNKYAENITLYDKNGNIKALNRFHNTVQVDQMTYSNYDGNKLLQVDDPLNSIAVGFKNGTNTGSDYTYDPNGNMKTDQNKNIGNIIYNHLNLPISVEIINKGTISYVYDAAGNKLKKTVVEGDMNANTTTIYYYAGTFVYKESFNYVLTMGCGGCQPVGGTIISLQPEITLNEEGRIRLKKINQEMHLAAGNTSYEYDYFLKDHLGNVRMVITAEQQTDSYVATMEKLTKEKEDALFANLSPTTPRRVPKPDGFDNNADNALVYKLDGTMGEQIGVSKVLKIMAADKISIKVRTFCSATGQTPNTDVNFLSEIVNILTGGITANGGGKGGANSPAGITSIVNPLVDAFLNDPIQRPYVSSKPKAYINYMYFDENFKVIPGTSGAVQVSVGSTSQEIIISPLNNIVQKHGYLYVFLTNESPQDVYFDDLFIEHVRGPVLEETHYYSFGMIIPNLSSQAIGKTENRYKYNGKELQSKEFADGSGLEWHDYGARMYDQQIGRWHVIDNYSEVYYGLTPYNYAGNTPINAIDIDGNLFIFANGFMKGQYMDGQRSPYLVQGKEANVVPNPKYERYAPDRSFYSDGPRNNGKKFDYWESVDAYYMLAYNDFNSYYTNGSFTPESEAMTRYDEGIRAGSDLIKKLESGEIKLATGETIKIVGHSQGAAFAGGIAWALSNSKYGSLLEFVDYVAPHQPGGFSHPMRVKGRQFSTKSDKVSSKGIFARLFGGSKFERIRGTEWGKIRDSHNGGMGGHYIGTWLSDMIGYWRSIGITVNVTIQK
ncbi:MAG: hypothetical protein K2Q24_08895 [Chitinophagaceae bacterium]|nr:hypothetical protein [Chitinophagaceae bacterium]